MVPIFECEASTLFCTEDNNSIMGFNDDVVAEMDGRRYELRQSQNHGFLGDFLIGLPSLSEECLVEMVEKEPHFLPGEEYKRKLQNGTLDSSVRKYVVDWIGKVHAHFNFGPLTAYRSISYFDRFISIYVLPQGISWIVQLLAIACLSLAAKIEENAVPSPHVLQACAGKCLFEAKIVKRMELLVLSTLQWRMQTVTPFSFLEFFLQKINDDKPPPTSSIHQSVEIILRTIRGIEFLEFRPSEIAAAVAICVTGESQTVDFNQAVSLCPHVEKGRVKMCHEVIREMGLINSGMTFKSANGSLSSLPNSPIGVLDAGYWSLRSDEITVGSYVNSHMSPVPAAKKLKFDNISDDKDQK